VQVPSTQRAALGGLVLALSLAVGPSARAGEPIGFEVSRNGISVLNLWPDGAQMIRLAPELLIPADSHEGPQVDFAALDQTPIVVELDGERGRRYVVQGRRPTIVPASEIFGVRCQPCVYATRISYLTSYTVEVAKRSKRILAFDLTTFCRVKRYEDGVPPGLADRECHDLKLRDIEWSREGEIVSFSAEIDGRSYRYP
jgi:hypothetical protein